MRSQKIQKIKIIPNYRKPWARKLAASVSAYLRKHEYYVGRGKADLTICVGGDGTILYTNRRGELRNGGAVLGIGSKSSHVCILKKNNWKKRILHILENGRLESRLTLDAIVGKRAINVINDVVIHTNDYRVIRIFLGIGKKTYSFEGDGVIVSTATGSSAYAYSAGGKILPTRSKSIEIVPICPYKRKFQARVLDSNKLVRIWCDRAASLIVDGMLIRRLKHKEIVKVKKGKGVRFLA